MPEALVLGRSSNPPLAASGIGRAAPRIMNALDGIAATARDRATLLIILATAGILAMGAFGYLILRRR